MSSLQAAKKRGATWEAELAEHLRDRTGQNVQRIRLAGTADVRYHARWLLRIVGAGTGRLTDRDRRLTAVAVSLLTKGLP